MRRKVWTVSMYGRLLVLDGQSREPARTPGRRRDQAIRALSRWQPDVEAARATLLELETLVPLKRRWTKADDATLANLYPETDTAHVARQLRRTIPAIHGRAYILGLHKTPEARRRVQRRISERLARAGKGTRFQKGLKPWNKGRHFKAGGRSHETRFKPGHRPHTWKPVGTERITEDGYLQRKMSDTGYPPRDWKAVHALLWEEENGPVPKGHVVVFKNGKKDDIRLENLELVSRGDLMARNTIHHYPEDVKRAIVAVGALKRAITIRRRKAGR